MKTENKFVHSYNDPIIDRFLTYLHQAYLESYSDDDSVARSFPPVSYLEVTNFIGFQKK